MVIEIGCDFGYSPDIEFFTDGTYAGPALNYWSLMFLWQGANMK